MTLGVYLLFLEFDFAPILFPVAFMPMLCPLQAHSKSPLRFPTAVLCHHLRSPPVVLLTVAVQPLLLLNVIVVRTRVSSKKKVRARTRVPFVIEAAVPKTRVSIGAEVGVGAVVLTRLILGTKMRISA